MRLERDSLIKTAGYLFVGLIAYVFITFFLTALAFVANQSGAVVDIWPVSTYQQVIYNRSTRNIWQYQKDCIQADPYVIYAPAPGECAFSNMEFDTVLNFDELGRSVPARTPDNDPSGGNEPGIAILGDSHAMGWGVNDDETFANVLQAGTAKPVYNLAVSSYGTVREVRRLVQSGLLDRVDTIIIQYCDNDLAENTSDIDFKAEADTFAATLKNHVEPGKRTQSNHLAAILTTRMLRKALTIPLRPIRDFFATALGLRKKDFAPHFAALKTVLKNHERQLAGKKIIIFYSNAHGNRFDNFEDFAFEGMGDVRLVDLSIPRDLYFLLDDHLNVYGHKFIGDRLAGLSD